jgi:hypothetical protein
MSHLALRIILSSIVAAALLASVHGHASLPVKNGQPTQAAAAYVELAGTEASVPLTDIGGRPVVEATINGKGPFRMLVDTGATRTVLSGELVEMFAPPGSSGPVVLDELRIGDVRLRWSSAGRGGNFLSGLGPDAPQAVLSAQAFPASVVTFDFPARRMVIRKGALPAEDGGRVFHYDTSDPLPVVPVTLNDQVFHVHLDTGAPATISLPVAAAKQLGVDGQMTQKGVARLPSGEFPRFEAPFKGTASVGVFPIAPAVLMFSDMRAGPLPPKGVIGMTVLRDFRVSVDADNRRVAFERAR